LNYTRESQQTAIDLREIPQGFENNTIESNASEEAHQNRFSSSWEKSHALKSIGAMVNVSRGRYSILRRMRFRMGE
jgi:hypothetical protein